MDDAVDYSEATFLRLIGTDASLMLPAPHECLDRNFHKLVFLIYLLVLPCTAMASVEGL